jgi:prephenate dehydrogenase
MAPSFRRAVIGAHPLAGATTAFSNVVIICTPPSLPHAGWRALIDKKPANIV